MASEAAAIEIAPNVRLTGDASEDASDRELHVRDGANLPALCIDCGAPVRGKPDVRAYRGFAPGAWWLFLFKAGTRAVVTRLFGRRADVGAFVCSEHVSSRSTKRIVGLIGLLAALPIGIAMQVMGMSSAVSGITFVVLALAAYAIRLGGTDLLYPKGVTSERVAVFSVPNEKFLQAATQVQRQPARPAGAALTAK
jgi:hypothetical protein